MQSVGMVYCTMAWPLILPFIKLERTRSSISSQDDRTVFKIPCNNYTVQYVDEFMLINKAPLLFLFYICLVSTRGSKNYGLKWHFDGPGGSGDI